MGELEKGSGEDEKISMMIKLVVGRQNTKNFYCCFSSLNATMMDILQARKVISRLRRVEAITVCGV